MFKKGMLCENTKNCIKSVQNKLKIKNLNIFAQGYGSKRTDWRRLWWERSLGPASCPARAHLGHAAVGLWRLGEQSEGRSVGHFLGLARLPTSAHRVSGFIALGEGSGCSVPGGQPWNLA